MRKIRKPDVDNTDPGYWERVLESHGLGERQLGLQEVIEVAGVLGEPQLWKQLWQQGTMEEADDN